MKFRIIIFFSLFLVPCFAFAQYTSRLGRFQVDEQKGCAPLTVTITNVFLPYECTTGKPCDMDFGDGFEQTQTFTHTYTQPGSYTLSVLFQSSSPPTDDIVIEVLPNIQPEFDIYTCSNSEVSVVVTDNNYDQYVIDYNDGTVVTVPSGSMAKHMHGFASAGNKTITVRGRYLNADDNCNANSKPFTALLTLPPPTIDLLTVLNTTQIQLDFTNQQNIQYRLEIAQNNATTFQQLQTVYNTNTVTIGNLNPEENYYCFRLGAYDPCTNNIAYSNTVCSANFDLAVQDNVNRLTWSTSPAGVDEFSILRDNQNYVDLPPGLNSYNDTDVVCKTDYMYQMITRYLNGSQSISLQKSGTAFSTTTPSPIESITGIVGSEGVMLEWIQDPDFTPIEYNILRGSGGSFGLLTKTPNNPYTDESYMTEGSFCYKVTYKDICDNTSQSVIESCPIRLSGLLQKDNAITLTWTPYSGWMNGVSHYIVEKYTDQGALLQTFNAGSSTTLLDNADDPFNQVYVYIVKAVANDAGLSQAVSNAIRIIKEPNLFHPTAFTPNGDNLNDVFKVFGQYVVDFELRIFNRWGELMYTTNDLDQGWDGTFKGSKMPEGTYVFVAKITDIAGRTFDRSGSVLLLKK